jgi:hypothetical protein
VSGALAAALLALAVLTRKGDSSEDAREVAWRRFPVFVWFHGGPPQGEAAFDVLRRHGLLGCNVEGADASDLQAKTSCPFYVDHLAGKGDLWLRPAAIEADQQRLAADLLHLQPARPNCFESAEVVARLEQRVDEGVRRHAPHRPLAYVLDDELSVTRGVNPMDYCFGPECLAGLRKFVLARYGSLERVGAAWRRKFATIDELVPPTTEATREENAGLLLAELDFTAWSDHREFMERALAERLAALAERARRVDPGAPIGFTGGELPSAFGGFDWWLLLEKLTLVEAYEGGLAPELIHGVKRPGTRVVTTWFVPDDAKGQESWSPWDSFGRVARGDDGAVIWSSGAIFDGEGRELNAAGLALAETVAAARTAREALAPARRPPADVVLLVSQPSVRATWMVDSWVDGKTWPRRLTSWETDHSSSGAAREGWDAVAGALGLAVDYVDVRELAEKGRLARTGARIVLLPEASALADADVDALLEFARGGGLVLADAHPLLFDERLHGRDDAALRKLFGVGRKTERKLGDLAAELQRDAQDGSGAIPAEGAALRADGAVASRFAGFVKEHSRGAAWLLDRRLAGRAREPARLAKFAAGLEAELELRGLSPARPRPDLASAGRVRWRRWVDAADAPDANIELFFATRIGPDREAAATTLTFPAPVRLEELLGRSLDPIPAAAVGSVTLRVDASHPLLLRARREARGK